MEFSLSSCSGLLPSAEIKSDHPLSVFSSQERCRSISPPIFPRRLESSYHRSDMTASSAAELEDKKYRPPTKMSELSEKLTTATAAFQPPPTYDATTGKLVDEKKVEEMEDDPFSMLDLDLFREFILPSFHGAYSRSFVQARAHFFTLCLPFSISQRKLPPSLQILSSHLLRARVV